MFYTSGEDRIFPKGLPVGKITSVKEGSNFQEVYLQPSGVESAPEEVLVIVDPVHQEIPDAPATDSPVFLGPDVKPDATADNPGEAGLRTQADQMMDQYRKIGAAQKHEFGEGGPGTPPPNFNLKVPGVNAPAVATGGTGSTGTTGNTGTTGAVPRARPAAAASGSTGTTGNPGTTGTVPRARPTAPPAAPKPASPQP